MAVRQMTETGVTSGGRIAARVVLTLAGAAGMIVGAFLAWTRDARAVNVRVQAFYRPEFGNARTFVATVGFVMILIGLVSILGLAARSGWLSRLAGALGIAAFVLFAIEVFRARAAVSLQAGAWLALAGAIVALVAGFVDVGPRTAVTAAAAPGTVTTTTSPALPDPPPAP